jgi:hypothetical protein
VKYLIEMKGKWWSQKSNLGLLLKYMVQSSIIPKVHAFGISNDLIISTPINCNSQKLAVNP